MTNSDEALIAHNAARAKREMDWLTVTALIPNVQKWWKVCQRRGSQVTCGAKHGHFETKAVYHWGVQGPYSEVQPVLLNNSRVYVTPAWFKHVALETLVESYLWDTYFYGGYGPWDERGLYVHIYRKRGWVSHSIFSTALRRVVPGLEKSQKRASQYGGDGRIIVRQRRTFIQFEPYAHYFGSEPVPEILRHNML